MSVPVMCLVDVCVVSCGIFCFGSGVFGVKSVWCVVCVIGLVCGVCCQVGVRVCAVWFKGGLMAGSLW